MKFCDAHWSSLREAIETRGLTALIAESGEEAATKTMRQLEGEDSIDSYEPLLAACAAISGNTMDYITRAGGNPLYLLANRPEDPVEGYVGFEGHTWPRCPLCYINLVHEVACDGKCDLSRTAGFDWMIERAADDALEHWKELRP